MGRGAFSLVCALCAALAACAGGQAGGVAQGAEPRWAGTADREVLVYEARSAFSHLRVRDRGTRRTLYFVRDNGVEVVQTSIDLEAPHFLQVPYTQAMFVSLLVQPRQASNLLVGLGGGAMVRFLDHFFPDLRLDVVEIDPAIVSVARDLFRTLPGPNTRIFTEDGFAYLRRTTERYDVIYMDAFLKPGEQTDSTGVPLRLKTLEFLRSLHGRLAPEGLVVFNLNVGPETPQDLAAIRAAFTTVYLFPVPGTGNIVAAGSLAARKVADGELRARAEELDRGRDHGFSFRRLLEYRTE